MLMSLGHTPLGTLIFSYPRAGDNDCIAHKIFLPEVITHTGLVIIS